MPMIAREKVLTELARMTKQLNIMEKKLYRFRCDGFTDIPEYCSEQKKKIEDAIFQVRLIIDACHLDAMDVEEWEIYDEEEMDDFLI